LQYAVFCNGKVRVAPTDINMTIEGGRMLGVKPELLTSFLKNPD